MVFHRNGVKFQVGSALLRLLLFVVDVYEIFTSFERCQISVIRVVFDVLNCSERILVWPIK